MYYWQSDTHTPFTPEGDWDREREKYGSYDGKIKPKFSRQVIVKNKHNGNKNALKIESNHGIRKELVNRRLQSGWSYEDAINKSARKRKRATDKAVYIGSQKFTFLEFAQYIGVTYTQLNYKFRKEAIFKTHWKEQEVAQLIENWYEKTKPYSQ